MFKKHTFLSALMVLLASCLSIVFVSDLSLTVLAADVDTNGDTALPLIYDIDAQFSDKDVISFLNAIDINHDGALTQNETDVVVNMELQRLDLQDHHVHFMDINGDVWPITAAFPNLERLDLSDNFITIMDLSNNPALTHVDLNSNNLVALNLTGLSYLVSLDVSYNHLTSLDLSYCPNLKALNCSRSWLSSLDIYSCPKLCVNDELGYGFFCGAQKNPSEKYAPMNINLSMSLEQYNYFNSHDLASGAGNSMVTPLYYPVVTEHPVDSYCSKGKDARFSVEVSSNSDIIYAWEVSENGVIYRPCTPLSAHEPIYTFPAKATYDGRVYRCKVTNSAGSVYSNSAFLIYVPVPTATGLPETVTARVGDKVELETHVETNSPFNQVYYQWQVKIGDNPWKNCTAATCHDSLYTFKASAAYDGRKYRCKITDDYGNTIYTTTAVLIINQDLLITKQPVDTAVLHNEKVSFTTEASGAGTVSYQWQVKIGSDPWKNCTNSTAATKKYSFTAKIGNDGRKYRCKITDANGTKYTNAATLAVRYAAPVVTVQPVNQSVKAGNKVTFSVKATGNGNLTYQWQVKIGSQPWQASTASGAKTDTLTFTAKAVHNGRLYRCIVMNGTMTFSDFAKLTVR